MDQHDCELISFFVKQKTAYEMCGRDWSSDVCSSDLWMFRLLMNDDNDSDNNLVTPIQT